MEKQADKIRILYFIMLCLYNVCGRRTLTSIEKTELCRTLECDETDSKPVCGIRVKRGESTYKLFDNECSLLKYGCQVNEDDSYGIINLENCIEDTIQGNFETRCPNCGTMEKEPVCGIRADGNGFRIRIFDNNCELTKHNCEKGVQFLTTDYFICEDHNTNSTMEDDEKESNETINQNVEYNEVIEEEKGVANESDVETTAVAKEKTNYTNIIVVGAPMSAFNNINDTVNNFFAATHVLDMPLREYKPKLSESTRRRLVKHLGPVRVFKPWTKKPKNVSDDDWHLPTITTCFHKCPEKCPDTYSPVCAKAGTNVRWPSIVFHNHCYMDVAQCKVFWEDDGTTPFEATYMESSFLFCLGDTMNGLYRFLPLIRTLQHMGRLKTKGHYKYRIRNLKFYNQMLHRDMKPMG